MDTSPRERIVQILATEFHLAGRVLHDLDRLEQDYGMDTIELEVLSEKLSVEFEMNLRTDTLRSLRTLQEIVQYAEQHEGEAEE